MEGFLHYRFGGLIFGEAYTWRGSFSEFDGISLKECTQISLENLYVDIGVKRVNGNLSKVDTFL